MPGDLSSCSELWITLPGFDDPPNVLDWVQVWIVSMANQVNWSAKPKARPSGTSRGCGWKFSSIIFPKISLVHVRKNQE